MKKVIAAAIAALAIAAIADAANREKPVSYRTRDLEMNGIADNWFVNAAVGVNGVVDNGTATFQGLAVEAVIGKWLTPRTGLRLGWHGVNNRNLADEWLLGDHKFSYNYLHVDAMFRVTNIARYNSRRFFDLDLVAGAGAILTRYLVSNWEFAGGFGAIANFRIWKDLGATVEADFILSKSGAWRTNGNIIGFPSVTAGICYNFGRRTAWQTKTQAVREIVAPTTTLVLENRSRELDLLMQIDSLRNAANGRDTVTVEAKGDPQFIPQIVYFDLDKSDLSPREAAHLEYLSWNLPAGYKASFVLYGSADKPTGNPRHNLALSKRRCDTVSSYLAEATGIKDITCIPEGDTNNRFEGMPKNRCVIVEIILTKDAE